MSGSTFHPDQTTGTFDLDGEAELERPALPRWVIGPGGDFEPTAVLGTGGMSVVSRATQGTPRRAVALKRPRHPGRSAEVRALVREGEVTAQVEHPNVVPVHAIGADEQGDPVVVLREIRGRSLAEELRAGGAFVEPPARRRVVEALIAVCHALEAAHHQGWVHCDVKAGNILRGSFGETWLVDWGIAQRAGTAIGFARGTPQSFAPEQALGGTVDERTDVYLVGATLTHVLTGRPRHRAASLDGFVAAALASAPADWPPGIPPTLAALADRCCRAAPGDRPASIAEVRTALSGWLDASHLDGLVDAAEAELAAALSDVDAVGRRVGLVKAQFALAEAHRTGHVRARAGLVRALDALIAADLEAGNPVSARSWAAGHPDWSAAREEVVRAREAALVSEAAARAQAARDWELTGHRRELLLQVSGVGLAVAVVATVATSVQALGWVTDVAAVRVMVAVALLLASLAGRALILARANPGHLARSILDGAAAFLALLAIERWILGVWMRWPPEAIAGGDVVAMGTLTLGWWPVFPTARLLLPTTAAMLVAMSAWPGHDALFLNLQVGLLMAAVAFDLLRGEPRRAPG
jgi:hypothetical protein